MDDLVTWLKAQLDDDERVARAAAGGRPVWTLDAAPDGTWYVDPGPDADDIGGINLHEPAEHIARWDPKRVLAEIQAKRQLLDLHHVCCDSTWCTNKGCATCGSKDGGFNAWPCTTLRALAQPYASRDGWREEWTV